MNMELTKDEGTIGFGSLEISQIKTWAEEIAGHWNGDEPEAEEKAMCAKEIAEKCAELQTLLDEMAEYI